MTGREGPASASPAIPPVPHLPRFRAFALFGRRPQECMDSVVIPASKNLHRNRLPTSILRHGRDFSRSCDVIVILRARTHPQCRFFGRYRGKSGSGSDICNPTRCPLAEVFCLTTSTVAFDSELPLTRQRAIGSRQTGRLELVVRSRRSFVIFQPPAPLGIALANAPVGVYEAARRGSRRSSDSPYREKGAIGCMDSSSFPIFA